MQRRLAHDQASRAPVVKLTTVTLEDILVRAAAPHLIHFVSLDIEGAALEALRAFPFERYRVAAWTIEHNREEPKRSQVAALLAAHGYRRVHEWQLPSRSQYGDLPPVAPYTSPVT